MFEEKRNLDGVYFRVKRYGKWENVCFSDLRSDEREDILEGKSIEWVKQLCRILADTISEIGKKFDLRGENDE
ncbi:MAG: hypothetical protein IJX39_08810 [Clostridia bacterium]|nr:hypothetical protein [Clostridia bacterium]